MVEEIPQDLTVTYHSSTRPSFPTFASQQWQGLQLVLHNVISYLENTPIEYLLVSGGPCGEWFHWFTGWSPTRSDEYSEPMREVLRIKDLYRKHRGLEP